MTLSELVGEIDTTQQAVASAIRLFVLVISRTRAVPRPRRPR